MQSPCGRRGGEGSHLLVPTMPSFPIPSKKPSTNIVPEQCSEVQCNIDLCVKLWRVVDTSKSLIRNGKNSGDDSEEVFRSWNLGFRI